jgi:AraC-like DNA-binding protein
MPGHLPRLLVIDHQPESVAGLIAALAEKAVKVTLARNDLEGHAEAIAARPDLIVLDLTFPASGADLCRRLKGDRRTVGIPLLCTSPSNAIDDKLAAFSNGAVDYLVKPFSEAEATARILAHLQIKRRIDRLESMVAQAALDRVGDEAFPDDQLFAQALVLLEKHLASPPGLIELSRMLGTNERKLTEIFRQRVGMSVFDYFTETRLESARHLLERSRMRVQAIASHIGYRNAGDFTRAFRRRFGTTPREHRRSHQSGSRQTI